VLHLSRRKDQNLPLGIDAPHIANHVDTTPVGKVEVHQGNFRNDPPQEDPGFGH